MEFRDIERLAAKGDVLSERGGYMPDITKSDAVNDATMLIRSEKAKGVAHQRVAFVGQMSKCVRKLSRERHGSSVKKRAISMVRGGLVLMASRWC